MTARHRTDPEQYDQMQLLAFDIPFDLKLKKSILSFQEYEPEALRRNPVGYQIRDSFGKDSDCIVALAKLAGVAHYCVHNLTTMDPPELIQFGKRYHPKTEIRYPPRHMTNQLVLECQGPPTRRGRWCCETYKEQTRKGEEGFIKVTGIRAEESARRAKRWRVWTPHREQDTFFLNPILYWTTEDVWKFHKQHNIPYCKLYDQGWERLGCVGCPMAGYEGRKRAFATWPKLEKAWQRGFQKFWERWHNVPTERERWTASGGMYNRQPLPGERKERRKNDDGIVVDGFWTRRRWYDLNGFQTWQDLWSWWIEEMPRGEDEDPCQLQLF